MSWEVVSPKTKRKSIKTADVATSSGCGRRDKPQSKEEIQAFLETYKTKACDKTEYHDTRLCVGYHANVDDQRRNPYKEYYSADDCQCLNKIESMYHPALYRTTLCRDPSRCVFGRKLCAHAHSSSDLRDRKQESVDYEMKALNPVIPPVRTSLTEYLPGPKRYEQQAKQAWNEIKFVPTSYFMPVPDHLWFVITHSERLMNMIKECALDECLGVVKIKMLSPSRRGLQVTGIYPDGIEARIRSLLETPSPYFASIEKDYGNRVSQKLLKLSPGALSMSNDILIQFLDNGRVRLTAVNYKKDSGLVIIRRTIDKWGFWIQQEGYNVMYECCCCYDKYNADQGITCKNGHFFVPKEMKTSSVLPLAGRRRNCRSDLAKNTTCSSLAAKHHMTARRSQLTSLLMFTSASKMLLSMQRYPKSRKPWMQSLTSVSGPKSKRSCQHMEMLKLVSDSKLQGWHKKQETPC